MKNFIFGVTGVVGSLLASFFGGWNEAMTTLLIVMTIDYITGVVLALVFHKSPKTETGAYESKVGWKGLFRKCMVLLILIIAHRIDLIIGAGAYVMNGVCIAFIMNDTISIVENAGLMGLPIPKILTQGIELLKNKSEEGKPNV